VSSENAFQVEYSLSKKKKKKKKEKKRKESKILPKGPRKVLNRQKLSLSS
jgi:hypothetical protein